jgi:hypothetical protein
LYGQIQNPAIDACCGKGLNPGRKKLKRRGDRKRVIFVGHILKYLAKILQMQYKINTYTVIIINYIVNNIF